MLMKEDLTLIGTVGRKHGTRGEVRLQLLRDIVNTEGDVPDCLFIELEGLPVPFFIDEWRERGTDALLVKFDDVDSDSQASALTGNNLYALTKDLDDDNMIRSWQAFKDYTVEDENGTNVGKVNSVDDRNDNILLYVTTPNGSEVILPLHEDLVRDINHQAHTLRLAIPEGLLTLND